MSKRSKKNAGPNPAQAGTSAVNRAVQPRGGRSLVAVISIVAAAAVVICFAALLIARPWEQSGTSAAPTPSGSAPASSSEPGATPDLITPETHLLSDAGPDAPTVVEFLDFECEACGAAFPVMESLREEYGDKVTFAVRYLPGHFNGGNAALAVEAAAQQGKFEEMYKLMFETQTEWGEKQTSEAPRFRGYAEQLGLDMAAFDAAVKDPATAQRIEQDMQAAQQLGLQATPSIFVNGELLKLQSWDDLTSAVSEAAEGASR